MRPIQFLIHLFFLIPVCCLGQQINYKNTDWDSEIVPQRFPLWQWEFDKPVITQKTTRYEFFNTYSGYSGEIKEEFRRMQFPDKASIEKHQFLQISFGPTNIITSIDFRIWKDRLLLYEGKSERIPDYITDSIFTGDGELVGLRFKVPFLEEGSILDFYYKTEGEPVPQYIFFHEQLPVDHSEVQLQITTSDPFTYAVSDSSIQINKAEELGVARYRFKLEDVPAVASNSYLNCDFLETPYVTVDYEDKVYRYDREYQDNWFSLADALIYNGPLENYRYHNNLLSSYLNHNISLGSFIIPNRYYRDRNSFLRLNDAMGSFFIHKDESFRPLYNMQQDLYKLAEQRSRYTNVVEEVEYIHDRISKVVLSLRENSIDSVMPIRYTLLMSFYTEYFKRAGIDYYILLVKSKKRGPIMLDFISQNQIDAIAIAFTDKKGKLHFVFPGYYWLRFMEVDQLPYDLENSTALMIWPRQEKLSTFNFSSLTGMGNEVYKKDDFFLDRKYNRLRRNYRYYFTGGFQHPLFHHYLLNDVGLPATSDRSWLVKATEDDLKESHSERTITRVENDSLWTVNLSFEDALLYNNRIYDRCFMLPFPYQFHYEFTIHSQSELELMGKNKDHTFTVPGVGEMHYTIQKVDEHTFCIDARVTFPRELIEKEEIGNFRELAGQIKQGITLNFKLYGP